jgi:thioredoxin 1
MRGNFMGKNLEEVTDNTFENLVVESPIPVLVDFWAEWCPPCKALTPILEDLAGVYSGKLKILKLNVDDNQNIPPKFGIRNIPTLILFKDGEVKATQAGLLSKLELSKFLDSHLS